MNTVEVRREPITPEFRAYVLDRDLHSCRYCGSTREPFHLDHVYPVSKGGETSSENIVTACVACNKRKTNRLGIYPLPIGHFKTKKKDNRTSYMMLGFIAQILLWSGAYDYQSFMWIGEIQIVLSFLICLVFILPDAIKSHIELIKEMS